ncbi:MAG: hypothetical protein AAGG08_08425 [Actinomycetota bacterium]
MPWCEPCAKYYTPNSVADDGSCPQCGRRLHAPEGAEATPSPLDDETAPWHFKLLVTMTVLYLGWRIVDLVV